VLLSGPTAGIDSHVGDVLDTLAELTKKHCSGSVTEKPMPYRSVRDGRFGWQRVFPDLTDMSVRNANVLGSLRPRRDNQAT